MAALVRNTMKKLLGLVAAVIALQLSSCKKDETIIDPIADAKNSIEAKYKAMGWGNLGYLPSGSTIKTIGGKGYVQYYISGMDKRGIYFFNGQGVFAMYNKEMKQYDAYGQDSFAYVASDPQNCGTGCSYNDMIMVSDNSEAIDLLGIFVTGANYVKYKELDRWDGPLGWPLSYAGFITGSSNTEQDFSKNGVGKSLTARLYWIASTRASHALWGKVNVLYDQINYHYGWLGLPIDGCRKGVTDDQQVGYFQKGGIKNTSNCGKYYDLNGQIVYQNGAKGTGTPPCY